LTDKRFKLSARVSSNNPSAIKPVLERIIGSKGSVKPADEGFQVEAELEGKSARDLNRMLLSEMRKVERRTRLRAEWTGEGVRERFFDYVPKGAERLESQ
jgi:hypothetical protein